MKIIFALILAAWASPCFAAGSEVQEAFSSTFTVNVVSVSSSVGTQMDPVSIVNNYRTNLTIQNLDVAYNIYCSQSASVTTATGFMIAPYGGMVSLPVRAGGPNGRITIYCITARTNGPSSAVVIQAN